MTLFVRSTQMASTRQIGCTGGLRLFCSKKTGHAFKPQEKSTEKPKHHVEEFLPLDSLCEENIRRMKGQLKGQQKKIADFANEQFHRMPLTTHPFHSLKPDPLLIFWSTIYRPSAPYKNKSPKLCHEDKETAISMLAKLKESGKIQREVNLIIPGCDNNEAGVKLQAYFESENIKTHMVATDVNETSLTLSRGLDVLLREKMPEIAEAEFYFKDFFATDYALPSKKFSQTITLPFRLTAIARPDQIVPAVFRTIKESDICCLHFLLHGKKTLETLQRQHELKKQEMNSIGEQLDAHIFKSAKGSTLCLWNPDQIQALVKKCNGSVLNTEKVLVLDDYKNEVEMLVVIAEKALGISKHFNELSLPLSERVIHHKIQQYSH